MQLAAWSGGMVARFFLVQKKSCNIPKWSQKDQMTMKYTRIAIKFQMAMYVHICTCIHTPKIVFTKALRKISKDFSSGNPGS
jgi:hypothetical protein